jgi:hypothetical protein
MRTLKQLCKGERMFEINAASTGQRLLDWLNETKSELKPGARQQ